MESIILSTIVLLKIYSSRSPLTVNISINIFSFFHIKITVKSPEEEKKKHQVEKGGYIVYNNLSKKEVRFVYACVCTCVNK